MQLTFPADAKDRSRPANIHSAPIDPALLAQEESKQPEPLLSLLTSQHPIIFTALNGPLQVYSSSKNYSPRFRQSAEFVENTVNTAGRLSGVETGVRWWLQRNETHENGAEDRSNKRRRMENIDQAQVEKGLQDITLSIRPRAFSEVSAADSLPPYDGDQRSPKYEETPPTEGSGSTRQVTHSGPPSARTWQTRLILSTSGLGVAMSQDSRNRLTYCLRMLRDANNHIAELLQRLKDVLSQWDRSQDGADSHARRDSPSSASSPNQAAIMQQVQGLKASVIKTLQDSINMVSQYAGGALPENARLLVKRHLTSLPQRFYLASSAQANASAKSDSEQQAGSSSTAPNGTASPEHITAAQRVVVLAREGLDMLGQVSGILDGTLESAEAWCNRLGMKQQGQERRVEEGREEQQGDEKVNGHAESRGSSDGQEDVMQGIE